MNEKYSIIDDNDDDNGGDDYYHTEEEIKQQLKDFEEIMKMMSDNNFTYEDACKMLLLKKGVPS